MLLESSPNTFDWPLAPQSPEVLELQITVSDLLERFASKEDCENHIDIAALLIFEMLNSVTREPSLEEIVAGLPEEVD